jgi:hypothetical protein
MPGSPREFEKGEIMTTQWAIGIASLLGAAFSTITTVYFWFIRVRAERPNLSCELADRELFLGAGTAETRQIGMKLSLVVINGSTLPNALLGVRLWVKLREGTWVEMERVSFDRTTPRPVNIPALQTAALCIAGHATFPCAQELEQGGNKTLVAYTERFLTNPREIKVELRGLNNRRFTSIVSYEAAS